MRKVRSKVNGTTSARFMNLGKGKILPPHSWEAHPLADKNILTKKNNSKLQKIEFKRVVGLILPLLRNYGVVKAGIFGSYARGEQRENSDVDILIQVKSKKFSLFDLVGLELELKKRLGKDIDLLTYKGLNPLIREEVLREEVRII